MTIGADMPLRSQIGARKNIGKGDPILDLNIPTEDQASLDFETIVKTAVPKLHRGKDEAVKDKVGALDEETDADADEPQSRAPVQGMFGQTMLALEQLLEKQRQHQEQSFVPVDAIAEEDAGDTVVTVAAPETSKDASPDKALPEKASSDKSAAIVRAEVAPAPNPRLANAPVAPSPERLQPTDAKPQEPSAEKSTSRSVEPLVAPSANSANVLASSAGQAEVRTVTTSVSVGTPGIGRTPISEVQVLSDRSSGATRTLVIQLQPIELGTVTARLRLTSEGMHIQLSAEERVAAQHLARDHEALGKALKLAGIGDDMSPVTIAVIDRSSPTSNAQGGQLNLGGQDQQADGRANGQGQAASGGAKQGGSTGQQFLGDNRSDELEEKAGKPGIESNLSRGLVI